jgi:hypothetical protein
MDIAEIISAIRELSFDRFTTPSLRIKGGVSDFMVVLSNRIEVRVNNVAVDTFTFTDNEYMEDLVSSFAASVRGYQLSYEGSYMPKAPTTDLLPVSAFSIATYMPIFRKKFFPDNAVFAIIKDYYLRVLIPTSRYSSRQLEQATDAEITEVIEDLLEQQLRHLIIWCAYQLVDKRRLYEAASEYLMQNSVEGTSGAGVIVTGGGASSIRVNVGDVFTMEESLGDSYNKNENPASVGADNVLGDARGFWYRLMLWLRKQIEDIYGDYSLRPNQAFAGDVNLQRPLNFYAYFDSYPYYISPLTRRIMDLPSSANWGNSV